ncbi:hypothetical protein ACFVY1_16565 [Streptomyces sp. NPDC058293]|uniref:DUF7927 domain-containing protein n=1 Tax=Streptomyces sp. NPDC058293 TaxID=3346429 RepID=UPI0036E73779
MWLRQVSGGRRLRAAATRTAGALVATVTALTALGAAAPASADVVAPFPKRYDESLDGGFVTIGNTVMGCPAAPADLAARCAVAAGGRDGANGTFVMRRVNTAGTTAGYGSSTGRVTIPPGAKVAYARLFFGGNDGTYKGPNGAQLARCDLSGADVRTSPGAPLAAVPVLGVNDGAAAKVSAEHLVQDPATTDGPHYYTGEADVTSMFAGVTGTGAPVPVAVGGVWAPDGKGCVAGWSMTVVYKYGAPNALARSVPVPDLEVTKTASPKTVGPRDTLTYTVRAKNISSLDYPNARFSDDLTGNLDDAAYNGDVRTDLGHVSYSAPRIGYSGDIPAGKTATVTYSVKIHDPVRGDGKLPSGIEVQSPRSNCAAGSTDPSCGTAPEIEKPQPPAPPALRITNVPQRPAVPPCQETGNTVTISDFSARKRTGAAVEWPVTAGSAPVASAGSVTKRGSVYVWKGDVAAHGKVVITQRVKASCTAGEATVVTVTAGVPRTNCPKARPGGGDPCTSVITARREQARPAPPRESHRPHGSKLAATGDSDTLLYGGLAAALCALGVLAVAAARSRRD